MLERLRAAAGARYDAARSSEDRIWAVLRFVDDILNGSLAFFDVERERAVGRERDRFGELFREGKIRIISLAGAHRNLSGLLFCLARRRFVGGVGAAVGERHNDPARQDPSACRSSASQDHASPPVLVFARALEMLRRCPKGLSLYRCAQRPASGIVWRRARKCVRGGSSLSADRAMLRSMAQSL